MQNEIENQETVVAVPPMKTTGCQPRLAPLVLDVLRCNRRRLITQGFRVSSSGLLRLGLLCVIAGSVVLSRALL